LQIFNYHRQALGNYCIKFRRKKIQLKDFSDLKIRQTNVGKKESITATWEKKFSKSNCEF